MDCEAAEARDPAAPVADLEMHRPGRPTVDLDHEQAELLRLALGAGLAVVFVLGFASHVEDSRTAARRVSRQTPEPSATPARIKPRPPSIGGRSGSSRIAAP
jgi:hypothetical protein